MTKGFKPSDSISIKNVQEKVNEYLSSHKNKPGIYGDIFGLMSLSEI